MVEALFGVLEREVCAAVCGDEVVLQVGDYHYHLVAADLDAGEVDRRIGQSEDIRAPSAARFDFAPVVDDLLAHELFDELGDRRNADVQFPGQFGQRTFAVNGHVGDDAAFDDVVFLHDALGVVVLRTVEKFL